ncbi:hypothetical protein QEV83_01495 [Methylocapsa sp. D3K7]|uniref:hypothetical protein n=1 Tax=Methylocapsa sp. D3K7 TaxID=3041435 RepID=UPI00244E7270|nr:hypothetical protein [Methylocapsa sp. D3K7]WGJ16671.1 hypothetical protein QEV83_01495 [Methylocapsa sp. D3K7]
MMATTLLDLIDARRTAFAAFEAICDRMNEEDAAGTLSAETERHWREACDSAQRALFELCAYPCETLGDARIKAEYIISMQDDFPDDCVDAFLESFAQEAA